MGCTGDFSKPLGLSLHGISKAQVMGLIVTNTHPCTHLPFVPFFPEVESHHRVPASAWFENAFQMQKKLEKFLKKVGVGKDDRYCWKQVGKALRCVRHNRSSVVYNETPPLGWWTLKPRPKEERELAHLYERREFPYPGDEDAKKEFVTKGGMMGTAIGPKGFVDTDKDAYNYQKELQDKKFEKEARKLWRSMKKEVLDELKEKGFIVE